jgi:hypothetical protein
MTIRGDVFQCQRCGKAFRFEPEDGTALERAKAIRKHWREADGWDDDTIIEEPPKGADVKEFKS